MHTLETLVARIDRTHYEWVRDEPTQEDLEQQNNMLAQIAAHNAAKANGQE